MKTVWIVNYYTSSPTTVSNPRHFEFAKNLTASGYQVRVFSSGYLRDKNEHIVPSGEKYVNKNYEGLDYTHVGCMSYSGNGVKRGLSIFQFAWRIFWLRQKFEKPDVILHNIHAPFDYPIIWCAKSLNAKYIAEAWDLWPDQIVRFGLMSAKSMIAKISYWIEKRMYEKSDAVVFSMEGGVDYLRNRGYLIEQGGKIDVNKVFYINNGVNLAKFEEDRKLHPTQDVDLLNDEIIKVVYLGSIRFANKVKDLIDAAEILRSQSQIKFIIIGDGVDRPALEDYCKYHGLSNVLFKQKHIPFAEVADVVSHASINIMNYQKDFGIYGVSSGKLFQYIAAGQPICCNVKLNYDIITRNDIGIADDLDTPNKYADAILRLSQLSIDEKYLIKKRIKEVAQKFDYSKLSKELMDIIEEF